MIILIGSRVFSYHGIPRFIDQERANFNFIATIESAIKFVGDIIQSNPHCEINFETHRLRHQEYDSDIRYELQEYWNHLDAKFGLELYRKLNYNIRKIRGIWKNEKTVFDIELAMPGSSAEQFITLAKKEHLHFENGYYMTSLPLLEAIKTSHIIFPNELSKHIKDLHMIRDRLKRNGLDQYNNVMPQRCKALEELMMHRRLEHYLLYGVPGTDYKQKDIDYIQDQEMYSLIAMEEKKGPSNKILFDNISNQEKVNIVCEEIMIVALKESLLCKQELNPQTAYNDARKRVQTVATRGFFREFAINIDPQIAKVPKNLIMIRDDILQICEKRKQQQEEEKQIKQQEEKATKLVKEQQEEKQKQEKLQKNLQIVQTFNSFNDSDLSIRVQHLFPMIFPDLKELELAKMLASTIKKSGGFHSSRVIYGCYFDDNIRRQPDFCFHANVCLLKFWEYGTYIDEICGYITVMHEKQYTKSKMYISNKELQEHNYNPYARLQFAIRLPNNNSIHTTTTSHHFREPQNIRIMTQNLNDVIVECKNKLVTSDFLMRFMVAVAYPKQILSLQENLYTLWRKKSHAYIMK